ncbi:lupus La protein [Nematocida sp. LUAm3]|nr:lupus La protein [Nematocida sp. LUAm3]KAI5175476.1 lupus La protein [Nematocida sp. LUAm2]KAI5178494.1 lupus La protein [Nematocida sp. LUAm1]
METEAIIKQVEFYFSDANILKDKFLISVMEANNGWVPISVISSFNRIASYKKTPEELEEIIKKSEKLIVAELKIKRIDPVPETYDSRDRSLLIKGLPVDLSLEQIEEFLSPHSEKIARITMRKELENNKKNFIGAIIIELFTEEQTKEMSSLTLIYKREVEEENEEENVKRQKIQKEYPLEIHLAKDYFEARKQKRLQKKEEKKQATQDMIIESFYKKIFRYKVKKENEEAASEEEVTSIKISEIKENLKNAAFVDVSTSHVRMKNEEESLPNVQIRDLILSFTPLSQEEVKEYCKGITFDSKKQPGKRRR